MELENPLTELKILIDEFKSSVDQAEERINKPEVKSLEIIQWEYVCIEM